MPLHPVCPVAELPPGQRKLITLGRVELGIFNVGGEFHAYRNICPHAGAPVCVGKISGTTTPSPVYEYNYGRDGCILRCPWHGWEFDLKTGEHLVDPEMRLKKFPVEVAPASVVAGSVSDPSGPSDIAPSAPACDPATENLDKFPIEIRAGILHVRLPGSMGQLAAPSKSFTDSSVPSQPAPLPSLFIIGDSISIQYGPYLEKLCAGTFAYDRKQDDAGAPRATHNLDVPTGANGGDSDMVLAYLRHRRTHAPIPADFLVLNCGLHDIKTDPVTGAIQVPLDRYQSNLRAIISETRAMNLRLVWIRTTPVIDSIHNTRSTSFHRFARDVAAYNAAADTLMAEAAVPVIDLHSFSEKFLPAGLIDHVHYTEELREKQASYIYASLITCG